jgi:hypothetical protein
MKVPTTERNPITGRIQRVSPLTLARLAPKPLAARVTPAEAGPITWSEFRYSTRSPERN